MSREREINLKGRELSTRKGSYVASAKIFRDTECLALCINITNIKTNKVTVSEWFNIEMLKLNEANEDWLASVIAMQMLTSTQAGREEKAGEIKNAWKELLLMIEKA